jgi:neutral amino acid transport system permease protein
MERPPGRGGYCCPIRTPHGDPPGRQPSPPVTATPAPLRPLAALLLVVVIVAGFGAGAAGAQSGGDTNAPGSIRGSLSDGDPVAGVAIVIATPDGVEIATAVSDDTGAWSAAVDPGDYVVTLDVATLPEGVFLQNPDRDSLTTTVRPGQDRTVLFPLGERDVVTVSRLDRLSNLAAEGVKFGLMIALAALGLSMVFGATNLVNFAHGELLAFGGIMAFWLERGYGPAPEMPLVAAAVIAVVLTAVLGGGLERGLFGPVRRRRSGDIAAMVISIGLAFALRHTYLILFGSRPDFYLDFRLQTTFAIGPVTLTPKAWLSILISGTVLLVFGWALRNTRLGTAIRAVSVNKDLAESSGIDVKRVIVATWIVGAGLAGLAGVLFGLAESVRWDMGSDVLLLIFAAVVLGGLGTAYGAMLGGLVVGLVTQLSTYWFPTELKLMFALMVLVAILMFRPQGILGVRERFG